MNCQQFNQELNRLLDERCRPEQDPILNQHANECSDCRAVLATQQLLFGQLKLQSNSTINPKHPTTFNAPSWGMAGIVASLLVLVAIVPSMINHSAPIATPIAQPQPESARSATTQIPAQRAEISPAPHSDLVLGIMKVRQYLPNEPRIGELQWLEEVSGGIQPLTHSMSSTLNVLKRTWPGSGRSQTVSEPQASRISRPGSVG